MSGLEIRAMKDRELEQVIELWRACDLTRPHNDPYRDISMARSQPTSEILVGLDNGKIIASIMVGHDGHRGMVYYVSTDPEMRKTGMGRQIMTAAEGWLKDQGIWKMNLMIRSSNMEVQAFYEAIGFNLEKISVMSKRLDPPMKPE